MDTPSPLTTQDKGARVDSAFRWTAILAAGTVLAVLALIVISTVLEARPAFAESGWKFITSTRWVPNDPDGPDGPRGPEFGALAFAYGSAVVSVIALFFAVPVSVGIALFTTEVAGSRIRQGVTTVMDLMAAVPSVVYGLWGVTVLAPDIVPVYDWVADRAAPVPGLRALFGEGATGRSFMTAGLILAAMITPIITSLTREVFATVPRAEKDAALALGATRWEMIKGAVFPHSFGGIVGAVMLGLGRAMGETIAVALTIGASARIVANLFKSGDAMPARIVNEFGEASGVHRSALVGLGVALFAITILVNTAARAIVARAEIRLKGVA
jgi:phosphate transport system permease protein